ncbi:MAG: hypothetical protein LW875_08935 [Proteobacteria bacterium]|jgi:hypothetical protein|nr:hypothetical protein [Pseudomonadota bacterium]
MFHTLIFVLMFSAQAQVIQVENNPPTSLEVITVTGDIEGDPNPLMNQARSSWKKACEDWKKEIREINKENQVVSVNCNSPKCEKEQNLSILCKSQGTAQVRIKK